MSGEAGSRSRRRVLAAAAVVALLAVLFALRFVPGARELFASDAAPSAPVATVPAPKPTDSATLQVPCWGCASSDAWPVAFRTDLDLLAPLGTGSGNAAEFFGEFADPDGRRNADWIAAGARMVESSDGSGKKFLPANDPFLLEAEPWCDQATMRFYPDLFALDGWETRIPNLIVPVTLARSWKERGLAATDSERAMADFRRAIRLGRLLRQEETTIVADLVGLAAIRFGAEGIYERALRDGDTKLALTAAIVLGEIAPQRLLSSERVTRADVTPFIRKESSGAVVLELPESRLAGILEMARNEADRRFRGEAILDLNLVRFLGTPGQRQRALAELEKLAASSDPRISALATWSRDREPTKEFLATLVESSGRTGR